MASTGVWAFLDLDGDGLTTREEWSRGTDAFRDDTDRDGLVDGWEVARGFDPLKRDSDGDGLSDGEEIRMGSSVLDRDTDGDGFDDAFEAALPDTDCDKDGVGAWAEVDDDADGRADHEELEGHRCNADVDGDGVLDGDEGAEACIELADCDVDGLEDGQERGSEFDPLNADSLGAGLYDSVLWAFKENGQEASGDVDEDGIPDGWEHASGLIDWGAFAPDASKPDLLIEYVRVQGPASGRYDWLDMQPSYRAVEDYIESATDFDVQWVETRVTLASEERPHLIPSRHADYYEEVLDRAAYSMNPYVTTVVMNPQHDQADLLHLGVAPIRGMLAAVDYGVHTSIRFNFEGTVLEFTPFWESVIEGGRTDYIQAAGFNVGGVDSTGEYYLRGDGYRLVWSPAWFATPPRAELDTGETILSTYAGASLFSDELASTILHELGHTLGLCHLEDAECSTLLTPGDQFDIQSSTMYSARSDYTVLRFLPSEWDQVRTYATCPPQEPIQLIAQGAAGAEVLDAKYGYALDEILDVGSRSCGTFVKHERTFEAASDLFVFSLPEEDREPPLATRSVVASAVYGAVSFVAAAGAGVAFGVVRWRRTGAPAAPEIS